MRIKAKTAAIFIFDDELKEPRKILFGDPKELQNLLLSSFPSAFVRLQEIIDSKPKTKNQLRKAIKKTQNPKLTLHKSGAMDDNTFLAIDYNVEEE